MIGQCRQDIEVGQSLSNALAKHPDVFPPLFTNMTRAGEVGGFLDSVLLQIAENYEAEVKLRGKVKAAMTYPVVVFVIAILAVIAMLLFVVPTFAGLYDSLGGTLPAPTQFLVVLQRPAQDVLPRHRRRADRLRRSCGGRSSATRRSATSSTRSSSSCRSSGRCSRRSRWRASPATSAR